MLWGNCGGRHPWEGEYTSGGVREEEREGRERESRDLKRQRDKEEIIKGREEEREEQVWEEKERELEGREVTVCMSACVCARSGVGGAGSWAPLLPSPLLSFPHHLQAWPQPRAGAGQADSTLSLFVYLSHPELAVNSTVLSEPVFCFNIANVLLLILYNLNGTTVIFASHQ